MTGIDIIRQGDVALVRVAEIPSGAVCQPPTDLRGRRVHVLAISADPGHQHAVLAEVADLLRLPDGRVFLDVKSPSELRHEHDDGRPTGDHDWLPLVPGIYEYIPQTEWDGNVSRRVED